MARIDSLGNFLTDVADAIREKKGTNETIQASQFDTEIENLPSGEDLSEYFNTSLSNGGSGLGGWVKLIKKLPNTITADGTNLSNAFVRYYGEEIPFIDTSNVTNMTYMFNLCDNLITIPLLNTANVDNMNSMFSSCVKLEEIPLIDTSNVTNMGYMFSGCARLKNVPLLNTSNVTNFYGMFGNCNQLTDTSLDNILQMCINATSYQNTKELTQLRINNQSVYPASRIQALPHYQDFIDAGWTVGY